MANNTNRGDAKGRNPIVVIVIAAAPASDDQARVADAVSLLVKLSAAEVSA
jgi:hypothetical protein